MAENLEYIDSYFNKRLSDEERLQFDQRVERDPAFAEEVAFYLNTLNTARAELTAQKKERFREIYQELRPAQRPGVMRRFWPHISAAAVTVALVLRLVFFGGPASPLKLADEYIQNNLTKLSPSMSVIDSVDMGKNLYNEKKFAEALMLFETILANDASKWEAMQYAGLASLRLEQYDKAIQYFVELENTRLESNPGKFYHALTLMKRNLPNDAQEAKKILQAVVKEGLYGKDIAGDWLGEF